MKYSVERIAKGLFINEETIRRWIRLGKLKAEMDSKKGGYQIEELDLIKFLKDSKYESFWNQPKETEEDKTPIRKDDFALSYAVTYYRIAAGITDMRIFRNIAELSAWFQSQTALETTVITKIEVV